MLTIFQLSFLIFSALIIFAGMAVLFFGTRVRIVESATRLHSELPDVRRYKPMQRLLSNADLEFASPARRRKMRAERREMFRDYLRCLTKDYGRLLAGVRRMMVESGADRPDLAKTLAKNRMQFLITLFNIELHLQLHALGIGKVDVSGLVEALDTMRNAISVMTPATVSAY